MHCEIGKHFSVDGNVRFFEAVHERAVGHTVGAGCCIDSHDPQFAEISFFTLTIIIGAREGVQIGFPCTAIDILLSSPIPLCDRIELF